MTPSNRLSATRSVCLLLAAAAGLACSPAALADPVGTAFTYQGELNSAGTPVNGTFDVRFALFDALAAGAQVGADLCLNDVAIVNGRFAVELDFGVPFNGQQRYLEVLVRADSGTGCSDLSGWEVLAPRQGLTATPHAGYALASASATVATNAEQLNGQPASFYQDAANITQGVLPSSRLAGSYSGGVTFSNPLNVFAGSGTGLTGLNASNLGSGTLASARLSGAYTNQLTFSNPFNVYLGDGTGLVSLNATSLTSGFVPSARLNGTYSNALTLSNASNAFTGSGAGLTALNASNLASGTVPSARLTGTYSNALTLSNASNAFTGSGAGLTELNASSITSGTLPSGQLAGTYSNALTLSSASNAFTGNGAGLTGLNASSITSGTIPNAQLGSSVVREDQANAFGAFVNSFAGSVGIGQTSPTYPLQFADTTGAKISLWGATSTHYGLGIQSGLLQIHTNLATSDIAFGHGSSAAFTEVARITGDGLLGIGTAAPATAIHVIDRTGVTIGSTANGRTRLTLGLTADSNGYATMQAIGAQGTSWGDIVINSSGGKVGIASATLSDSSLHVDAAARSTAITGIANATSGSTFGGEFIVASTAGTGLSGEATADTGVTYGVRGLTDSAGTNAMGVRGEASRAGANYGVYGMATGASSFGVYANGRLGSSGTKSFMIDHPLDPEHKFLLHYSLESPEVLNVYAGITVLDEIGEAWITLPDYFESINIEPRYTLTSVGGPAPMLHVAVEVEGNRFKVAGGAPNAKVSWEIKAKRNDAFVRTYGAPVERTKVEGEVGTYLRPELAGKPDAAGQFAQPANR